MKRIISMNSLEAEAHYKKVIWKRTDKAIALMLAGFANKGVARRTLLAAAAAQREKAEALKHIRPWMIARAEQMREEYSLPVAFGFLKANGFSFEGAVAALRMPAR
jgi:hypothetical protein